MQTAIAGGRRACQAAALTVVLCAVPAAGQTTKPVAGVQYVEARTPSGVVVRENCVSSYPLALREYTCGELARRAADVITRLGMILGPFPLKTLSLDLAQFNDRGPTGYVLSAPGNIKASLDVFHFAGGELYLPDLLPREVARQWFLAGAAPVPRSDEWVAEGLPEYLAWRYLRETNPEAARAMVALAMRDSAAGSSDAPVFAFAGERGGERDTQIVSFRRRGLLVLRTLETVIDRERVDRVLPEFVRRYGGRSFSTADFEKVCEEIAGRNLGWFFRYFFEGKGIPEIELRPLRSETPGVAAGEIVVKGLPPEGSVRVEMAIHTAQGVIEHSVATRGEITRFSVNVPAPALGITLDPDLRILRWTEAAEKSKRQFEILAALPEPITAKDLPAAIELYRRALAADVENASSRAQSLHERLGELEWAHDEWNAALADLDAAINGHSLSPFETYLCRGKAYLYHGVVQLHERRPKDALQDALAGVALPREVIWQDLPERPIESHGRSTLRQLLQTLIEAATHY